MDALTSTIKSAKRVILSVGSGDGSQQAAIVKSGHHNIVSTFFDNEDDVCAKYKTSRDNIALLREKSTVLFGVDATKLHHHPDLKDEEFDIVLFSFPHTGTPNFACGQSGANPKSIEDNKQLIRDFLRSAQHVLTSDGEINITLKTSAPYDKWTFPDFAGYDIEHKSQYDFDSQLFPGYIHRSTKGHVHKVKTGSATTYVFSRRNKHDRDENGNTAGFSPPLSFTVSIEFLPVDDDYAKAIVMEILSVSQEESWNVLDIRRRFPEATRPDTRQLNRVLYQMESSNQLIKGAPKKVNQKPTWKLAENSLEY
ncbi:hypothetical protein ACHAWF_007552 [Thalassiosira exigua]